MSDFGYEQRPEYEYGAPYGSRSDYSRSDDGRSDYPPSDYDRYPPSDYDRRRRWSEPYAVDDPDDRRRDWAEPEPYALDDPDERSPRKATRLFVVAASVVALLLVGAMAFAGTVLLGGSPAKNSAAGGTGGGQQVADPATSVDVSAPASPEQPSSPYPVDSPTPTPSKAAPTKTAPSRAAPSRPTGVENLSAENGVLVLVNAERAKAGCKALTVDSRLAAAARKHSADMVARDYFSHTTPDGVEFAKRIDNEGYKWSTVGENIAAGQPNATEVMKAWMNSPGHRANILNCTFRNIGIGVALDGRRPFWTQDFGTPR